MTTATVNGITVELHVPESMERRVRDMLRAAVAKHGPVVLAPQPGLDGQPDPVLPIWVDGYEVGWVDLVDP